MLVAATPHFTQTSFNQQGLDPFKGSSPLFVEVTFSDSPFLISSVPITIYCPARPIPLEEAFAPLLPAEFDPELKEISS